MKPKLLIVDDDDEIRTQMRWALASEYDVVLAGDRPEAIEAFQSARPSVVLLDLGLPPHPGTPEEGLATLSELLAIDGMAATSRLSSSADRGKRRRPSRRSARAPTTFWASRWRWRS